MFPHDYAIHITGWYHLVLFLILPLFAIRSWWKLIKKQHPLPNRLRYLRTGAVTTALLASVSL